MTVGSTRATVNLGLSYTRKFMDRYTWSTQVNVDNALNHSTLLFPPSTSTSGNPLYNNYVRTAEPRVWIWTNSIAF